MKIGVYGLGRFGSFFSSVLSRGEAEVIAASRSVHTPPDGVSIRPLEEVLSADYLFFAVSISSFESVLKSLAPMMGKDTVVLDTCSVKVYPAKWMKENLPHNFKIATHPMFGPDSARGGLDGLPFVFSPIDGKDDERYEEIKSYISSLGLKAIEMSVHDHDKEAAYSQGVTHFVGRTLEEMHMEPTEIATNGYKMLMRIVEETCNDSLELFYDLQRFNPYAKEMRLSLQVAIEKVLNRLRSKEEY